MQKKTYKYIEGIVSTNEINLLRKINTLTKNK